jgi:orotidine-5'-phosphate decarboxylase
MIALTNAFNEKVILALDTPSPKDAWHFLEIVGKEIKYVKVGHRLYFLGGSEFVSDLVKTGYNVFLDLKFHDIPNTVAMALQPLMDAGLWSLTLHAAGGRAMLEAAVKEKERSRARTRLFGVTILTSHSDESWKEVNPGSFFEDTITARAILCEKTGLDGLVCSPSDLNIIDSQVSSNFLKIVPGIRLERSLDDQMRALTPGEAVRAGASYLVIGRPLLKAEDPLRVLKEIKSQLGED